MTRQPAPTSVPVALTIATSDSGGGAGVQADLKTMEACGTFGTSVLAATTAQHTHGVESVHVLPTAEIGAQLDAVIGDFDVGAAKTGMLATADVVEFVAERARDFPFPLVVDPVMVATSGDRLLEPAGEDAYKDLIAEATLVTPNADEAAVLTGIEIDSEEAAIEASEALREMGATAALVKGGHVPGDAVRDVLVTDEGATTIPHPRVETEATHGSGCTLASAITAYVAYGDGLDEAVREGISLLSRAVRYPLDVGEGPGAVHHLVALRERAARAETMADVREIADAVAARDVSSRISDAGMTVAGATPYAETAGEVATAEGPIADASSGTEPTRGVGFGVSGDAARFLLTVREAVPELRFALDCRSNWDVEAALSALDGPVVGIETGPESGDDGVGGSAAPEDSANDGGLGDVAIERAVRRAFETEGESEADRDSGDSVGSEEADSETPVAAIDRSERGGENSAWIVAPDSGTLIERTLTVLDRLDASDEDGVA